VVIGTPKLDPWASTFNSPKRKVPEKPVICFSFHWDGSAVAPEAGNAWEYYRRHFVEVQKTFKVIGHGHPKILDRLTPVYNKLGIPVYKDFEDVMEIADLYVNDASSTLYEFCVTNKPVVVLNAPWFRRNFYHGIRFWDYSDIGVVCNKPENLLTSIHQALEDPTDIRNRRRQYVKELYPNLGCAAEVAAKSLEEFCYD
jgi:CDP-glycerol glycerophosphotransferase (TagB/SpsB family)